MSSEELITFANLSLKNNSSFGLLLKKLEITLANSIVRIGNSISHVQMIFGMSYTTLISSLGKIEPVKYLMNC